MSESTRTSRDFVFQGTVVRQDENHTTVRLFPGLDLDLRKSDIEEIDQAADEVTQRDYVRVKLSEDAEVSANFKPRLARLALAAQGVPFAYGGIAEGARHALPSGSFDSILPFIDARGLSLFRGRMPENTWGALAGGAVLASNTTSSTTSNTDTKSDKRIEYDTVTDVGGQVTHTPDHETMSVGDDTKTDTASDTKTGDWY